MTIAPAVGDAVQALGAALRFAGSLTPLVREGGILMIAVHHRCEFEWIAHETPARAAGLDDDALAAILRGEAPAGPTPVDATAFACLAALLASGYLERPLYDRALAELGDRVLAELVWLCGYYSMLALALATFEPAQPPARRVFGSERGSPRDQ